MLIRNHSEIEKFDNSEIEKFDNSEIEKLDNSEIEKLDPQLQGQLKEALELLKDVVDEAWDVCPNVIDDIRVAVFDILEP